MKLIHIGDLNGGTLRKPHVTGFYRAKPRGYNILWAFSMDHELTWIDRVKSEDYLLGYWDSYQKGDYWTLELNPNARIAVVDSQADLRALMGRFPVYNPAGGTGPHSAGVINWRKFAREFDACFLTGRGEEETRSPGGLVVSRVVGGEEVRIVTDEEIEAWDKKCEEREYLGDWDFESVVVLNAAVIRIVSAPVFDRN